MLDDGWFGKRDADTTSLGDWFVDRRKLPNGLDGLADEGRGAGIKFGLWIEPEMVSERSQLFAAHPDWAIGVPGRPRTEGRQQLVLDMSRPEVVDHLFGVLSEVLASAPVSYVKWDMNRTITEPFSIALPADRQGEFFHRYILGVYDLYARLTAAFPEILFESCAGGGGRFDPGMLAFAPQAWTSDDTDAVERLRIQWGTSLAYPLSSMGAHVSAVPNHQTSRITPIATRAAVAFFGVLGYELDPTALTAEDQRAVADQVGFYKANRELFQRGRFVRLRSPFEDGGNQTAWMVVAPDRSRGRSSATTRSSIGRSRPPITCAFAAWSADALSRLGLARHRRSGRPRQRRRPGRRRPDGRRACRWGPIDTRPDAGATSGPGCSCSRRCRRGPDRRVSWCVPSPIYGPDMSTPDRTGPYSTDATVHMRPARRRCPKSICMRLGDGP